MMDKLLGIMPYVYFFDEPIHLGKVTFIGVPDWQGRNHVPALSDERQSLQELSKCFSTTRGLASDKGVIKAITYFLLDGEKKEDAEITREGRKAITLLRYALLRPDIQALDNFESTTLYAFELSPTSGANYQIYHGWVNFNQEIWVSPKNQKFPSPGWDVDFQLMHTSNLEDLEQIKECFYSDDLPEQTQAEILLAMEWYNQSFQKYSIRNISGYLVDVATAFETLFKLPKYNKTKEFTKSVKQCLGLQDEPLIEEWCRQFYKEVRSETLHTGKPKSLLFRHPDAELPHLGFLWFAQFIFRECVSALAGLPRHIANDRLVNYLIPNEVHLSVLRHAGSWGNIRKGNLVGEIGKLRQVGPPGKRRDIIWLGKELLTSYKPQLARNEEQSLPTLDIILDTQDTGQELALKYHRFYKEFSPLYFGKPISRKNLEQLRLMSAIYHFANFATWALLFPS